MDPPPLAITSAAAQTSAVGQSEADLMGVQVGVGQGEFVSATRLEASALMRTVAPKGVGQRTGMCLIDIRAAVHNSMTLVIRFDQHCGR